MPVTVKYDNSFSLGAYYQGFTKRIFTLVGIKENDNLFSHWIPKVTDGFLIVLPWNHELDYFEETRDYIVNHLQLPLENFYILANKPQQVVQAKQAGFASYFVHRNFTWDWEQFNFNPDGDKHYDAVFFNQLKTRTRPELINQIPTVAIVNPDGPDAIDPNVPEYKATTINNELYGVNDIRIQQTISQSKVGLRVSKYDGTCWPDIEYLYCGLPIVATQSCDGREAWYEDWYIESLPEDPDSQQVANAVSCLIDKLETGELDPKEIRAAAIEKAQDFRSTFVQATSDLFNQLQINVNPREHFKQHYYHRCVYHNWANLQQTLTKANV